MPQRLPTPSPYGMSLALAVLLCACGGGGSSSNSTTLSGAVIDGYIEGAKVCLDVNANGLCESSEPTATTNSQGQYKLDAGNTNTIKNLCSCKDLDGLFLQRSIWHYLTLIQTAVSVGRRFPLSGPLATRISELEGNSKSGPKFI